MKGLKRASKAAVSLWLSAVMTVLPAAGGMIDHGAPQAGGEEYQRAD